MLLLLFVIIALFSCGKTHNCITLIPETTLTQYTVTFNVDGGTIVPSQTIINGGKAIDPKTPTRLGYAFENWYKDSAKTTAFDFTTETVTGDITIYAKWTHIWNEITSTTGTPPSERNSHSTVEIGGSMYVFGGFDGTNSLNDLYKFTPNSTGTGGDWEAITTTGTTPNARLSHSAVVIDGSMYIFGGYSGASYLNDLHKFTPSGTGGTWTPITATGGPAVRRNHSAVMIDGSMYVFGGLANTHLNELYSIVLE